MDNKFITIKEASSLLGVSKLTLRNWDNSKKLVSYRNPINNYRLYKKQDIINFINQKIKSKRYNKRAESKVKIKAAALKRIENRKKREKLFKLGK